MSVSKRLKFLGLTTLLCAGALLSAPYTAKAEAFTPEQKEELNKMFGAYLEENGEAVIKAVDKFRAKQEEKTAMNAKENLKKYEADLLSKDAPATGKADVDVTIE